MGHVEFNQVTYLLPNGRGLLEDVSFRVGEGHKTALVGPNGAGKSTLLQLISRRVRPDSGTIAVSGEIGLMPQFIVREGDGRGVAALMESVASAQIRALGQRVRAAEADMARFGGEKHQMRYAEAMADYADAGGYDLESLWDDCTRRVLGQSYTEAARRPLSELSGGEQKRLVLEALLAGPQDTLLLDEPDNYLDVPGKIWLEERLRSLSKTVLLISHDRSLLDGVADRIITLERSRVWVHGGGFGSYARARRDRASRMHELRRRWDEEHEKLKRLVSAMKHKASYNDAMAPSYRAAQSRLKRFEQEGPPPLPPKERQVRVRLAGGRTARRAVICESLELTGLQRAFTWEAHYGDRVAVLGANGSGKSHFLRLLAGQEVEHSGRVRLGARVTPGYFSQVHDRPELSGRSAETIVIDECASTRSEAMHALSRYGLDLSAGQPYERLSGGEQARLQILLLELSGATLLLLDEPTDNLDLTSSDALQEALASYEGTVIAVTHDRWFAQEFDHYLVFGHEGGVTQAAEPVWDA